MLVSKWGNRLDLKSGDRLEIVAATAERAVLAKDQWRARAVERMRACAWPLPADYVFDRDAANAR